MKGNSNGKWQSFAVLAAAALLVGSVVFGLAQLVEPDATAGAGTLRGYSGVVLTATTSPAFHASEWGLYVDQSSGLLTARRHLGGLTEYTSAQGVGRRAFATPPGGIKSHATDAGTDEKVLGRLKVSGTANGYTGYVTVIARNANDYAAWRVQYAVKRTGDAGTLAAIGTAAAVGTAIAPTNYTAGAKYWRLTPKAGTGNQELLFDGIMVIADAGASIADVTWELDGVSTP